MILSYKSVKTQCFAGNLAGRQLYNYAAKKKNATAQL